MSKKKFDSEQDRLREIAHILGEAEFNGFVPSCVVRCYRIAYDGLSDKRGFRKLDEKVE